MHHNIIAFLLCSTLTVFSALAYEDDYVEVTLGADGCITRIDNGDRIVYVFSNLVNTVTVSATLTLKQDMTLKESLVVGGGGAGGGFKGGGGGGGGVVYDNTGSFVSTGSEIALTVGAGGIGNTNRKAAKPQDTTGAGYGSPSSLTLAGDTVTAYGGGGGGSDFGGSTGAPSKMTASVFLGSGGGAGSGCNINQTTDYYTASQGNMGGLGDTVAQHKRGTGGGGGAGAAGQDGSDGQSGNGGEGVTNSITGVDEVYGSGGGGGGAVSINSGACTPGIGGTNAGGGSQGPNSSTPTAGAGAPGFGGGGGGGYNSGASAGGNGGSGTVILSFTAGGQAGQPTIDPNAITVEYTDGYTQPNLSVTLGGDEGAVYTASLVVYCVTGSVEAAAGEWTSTNVYEGLHLGDTGTGFATVYPLPGGTYTVKAIASAEGAVDAVAVKTFTVPDDQGLVLPPYYGKGGGPGVIHVRLGARGRGTGENWNDAYTDFRSSLKLISADRPELWFSGSDTLSSATAGTVSITNSAAIRGGFAGVENSIGERAAASYSDINGIDTYDPLVIANAAPATVDGFRLRRGLTRGLTKSGAGDITVTNCVFESNGPGSAIAGRAMQLSGNAASTQATIADCVVMRHYETGTEGSAGAVYLTSLHEATVSSCLFASNGLALTSRINLLGGRTGFWGVALAINGVPTLVKDCQFRANVAPTIYMTTVTDYKPAGGIARFKGNAGGSVFRNCLFTGNANIYGRSKTDSYRDPAGGALVVEVTDGQTVQVENCTFAYNIHSGEDSAACLTVVSGAAAVTNSIFTGSVCTTGRSSGHGAPPGDIMVASTAAATVGFSLMSGAENRTAAEGGELVVGAGCIDTDPLLVSPFSELSPYLYTGEDPGFMDSAGAVISAINAHLRGGQGYFDERTGSLDTTYMSADGSSPAIDAGDPASGYAREPDTRDGWHGRRINMGFYGNTPWATMSPFPGGAVYLR